MNVGADKMVIDQDYFYWSLIEELVLKQKYTILAISQDSHEVLLEPFRNKQFSIVRLRRMDVDWGNSLALDIQHAGQKFEQLLRSGVRGPIHVMNIYVSSLPPVDDYPEEFEKGYSRLKGKIDITSTLLVKNELEEGLQKLEEALNVPLIHKIENQPAQNIEIEDIQQVRNRVINHHNQLRDEEREIFQNGKPFFTYIFLAIQIIMFLFLELFGGSTNTETLIRFGAKYNPLIFEGEWWRFFTPVVLHIGFLHLLMNSVSLYYIGPAVERAYGSFKFLFIYFVSGIAGTIVSFAFSPSLSAGASGAIFGCFGALLYIGVHNREVFFRTMGSNLLVIVGINLALGFVIPSVDNAGHIGGLVGGFLAALIVQLPKKKLILYRLIGLIATVILLVGFYRYGMNQAEIQYTTIRGQELIKEEKFQEAYSLLSNAIVNENSANNDLLLLLSVTEIELRKFDQAEQHLQQIISNDDSIHQAHYFLAVLYINIGEISLAEEAIANALKYEPTNEGYKSFKNSIHN
ncbi:rhomboid family intramembrane serine protease [Metabacillus sediminilitoris]|uniref:Rhomboid family intramembrane serine protease n=2 Tax=Metabacillus sediminilitoris TaxID=2567941 RepID=A0A4S4C0L3_9BACI|nr:rhomboid family intramembrane serine protease [Metabacillus sediminilitoris]QGQ47267.1 rhomboid family intramembrane serine protease [Metabacillus sediminilitoris]THF80609.1 rhomboid family intramembrane serine protease [Metabacillus sediminilitoris]